MGWVMGWRVGPSLIISSKSCLNTRRPYHSHLRRFGGKKRAQNKQLFCPRLRASAFPVFYHSLQARMKQQIKWISVTFQQECLCFDFAILLGFAWIKARDRDRIFGRRRNASQDFFFFNSKNSPFFPSPASFCRGKSEICKGRCSPSAKPLRSGARLRCSQVTD